MSIFKEETINSIIKKAKNDKTSEVSNAIKQLMDLTKKAGELGLNLEELSVICTTGWYISQDPMMGELMRNMMNMEPPSDDEFIN